MRLHRFLPLLAPILLWSAPRAAELGEREATALYFADLGPESVDVSAYPKEQQENYRVFQRVCARCHTLARPLNSPRASRRAWEAYIFEMRLRAIVSEEYRYSAKEGRAARDFLVYDAHRRKNGLEFELKTAELQSRFAAAIAERMRRYQENNPKVRP